MTGPPAETPKLDIEQRARAEELVEDVINRPEDVAFELIWLRDEVRRLAPLVGGIVPIGTASDDALTSEAPSAAPSEAAVAAACEALYHSEWRSSRLDPYELATQMRSVLRAAYTVDFGPTTGLVAVLWHHVTCKRCLRWRAALQAWEVLLLGNFAAAMAERLEANSFKAGWQSMNARQLLTRLKQEVGELDRALKADADTVGAYVQRVTREAADVANFAAMIADVVREQSVGDES